MILDDTNRMVPYCSLFIAVPTSNRCCNISGFVIDECGLDGTGLHSKIIIQLGCLGVRLDEIKLG